MPSHKQKRRPGLVFGLLIALPIAALIAVRSFDILGDNGMVNVITALCVLLIIGLSLGWFLLRSGASARARLSVFAATAAVIGLAVALLRFEGVSGEMVPKLAWRWSPERAEPTAPAEAKSSGSIDLRTRAATDWPGFLGPRRDQTVRGIRLARSWDPKGPELLWKQAIGKGWSAFAIVGKVAVTQEQRGDYELVTAYELETGKLLWSHQESYRKSHPVGGAGPRSTPLIDDGRCYAIGASGILVCLDGANGRVLWRKNLPRDFAISAEKEIELVEYGRSTSPLVVGDLLIAPVGGKDVAKSAGLVAFDKASGALRWKSPPRHISCASPSFARLAGREQILVMHEASAAGHDPKDGSILWEYDWPANTSTAPNCSQVAVLDEERVLLSKGYGRGSAVLRLRPAEASDASARITTELVWASRRSLRTKFTNIVHRDGHAFALSDGILECISLADGKRVWKRGRFGHGQILLVDDLLLVLTEQGELVLLEASPSGEGEVLARIEALEGKTWNTLALAGPLLAIRNAEEAAVYRLPLEGKR